MLVELALYLEKKSHKAKMSKLLPSVEPALTQLLAQCQQAKPGAYSVIGPNAGVILTQEIVARHENWLPLRSLVLYGPLPHEQRARYLDAYHHKPVAGWLLVPVQRDQGDLWWVFNYIEPRFTLQMTLNHEGWEARYYVVRVDQPR